MDNFSRLVFEVSTPKYLGSSDIAHRVIEILRKLPKEFHPTKTEDFTTFKKSLFSFNQPQSFIDRFEGINPVDSGASLYKVKKIFDFAI